MKIFSFILMICLLPIISIGQNEIQKKERRTDNFIRMKGLRVGMDITRPMQSLWNIGNRYGTELTFDAEVKPNIFAVLETGWEQMNIKHDYINYKSSGTYARIGVDYNFLEAESRDDMDILYIGVRYAASFGKQSVPFYTLNNYWEDYSGHFPDRNYNCQWVEALIGIKAEIFHNFFLGWSIRGKILMSQKELNTLSVYFDPGYGKAENNFNFDFTYTVSYNLPFKFRN